MIRIRSSDSIFATFNTYFKTMRELPCALSLYDRLVAFSPSIILSSVRPIASDALRAGSSAMCAYRCVVMADA